MEISTRTYARIDVTTASSKLRTKSPPKKRVEKRVENRVTLLRLARRQTQPAAVALRTPEAPTPRRARNLPATGRETSGGSGRARRWRGGRGCCRRTAAPSATWRACPPAKSPPFIHVYRV